MNVFRLIDIGKVDKIIAFDALPSRLLTGIRMKAMEGFPRYWQKWLKDGGSVRTISRVNPETGIKEDREEPFTFMLDHKVVNTDIEKWQEITNYVRKAVDLSVRLMDKIEDMAVPFSKDPTSELSLEPEQVPIVPVPSEKKAVEPVRVIREPEVLKPPKPRGRPPKVRVAV